jgi:hypothetical protein
LKLRTYSVEFIYEKEVYDKDLTKLAFLNTVRREFDEQVHEFRAKLNKEILEETGSSTESV